MMIALILLALLAPQGDPLPTGAAARLGSSRFSHEGNVLSVAFSPDGKILASAGRSVRLWEADTGRLLREIPEDGWAGHWIAFSPDGASLLTGVSGTRDRQGGIRQWDIRTGRPTVDCGSVSVCYHVAFSRDTRIAAFGSTRFSVGIWDLAAQRELCAVSGDHRPYPFALSPDAAFLATERKEEVVLWDARTGREIRSFRGHESDRESRTGQIYALRFSPDGKILASAGRDRTLRLWDPTAGRESACLKVTDCVNGIAFSSDSKTLAFGNFTGVQVWRPGSGKNPLKLEGYRGDGFSDSFELAFSPDGGTVAGACRDSRVRLWETMTGRRIHAGLGHDKRTSCSAFSPDGSLLASGSEDGTVRIWDLRTAREIRFILHPEYEEVLSLAWSPDGRCLASGTNRGTTRLWDSATGAPLFSGNGDGYWIHAVAFSPDGKILAAGARNHIVELWDLSSGQQLTRLDGHRTNPHREKLQQEGHRAIITSLNFSPDGRLLVSTSADGTSVIWEMAGGKERYRVASAGSPAKFTPDNRFLAASGSEGRLRLIEADSGQETSGFGPESSLVALGSGMRLFVTRPSYDTLELWETASAGRIRTFSPGPFTSVELSPNGSSIVTAMEDGTLLVWPTVPADTPAEKNSPSFWEGLAEMDAEKAWAALGAAIRRPEETIRLVRGALMEGPKAREDILKAIRNLDHDEPAIREESLKSLEGIEAEADLRKALEEGRSSEAQARLTSLLRKLNDERSPKVETAGSCRVTRAVHALELIGTRAAREALGELAESAPRVRVRIEAREALKRLRLADGRK